MRDLTSAFLVLALGTLCVSVLPGDVLSDSDRTSVPREVSRDPDSMVPLAPPAPAPELVLYTQSFDAGATCTAAGWLTVDRTAQPGVYFHVDDYLGLPPVDFAPLFGVHSLWCGIEPAPIPCGFAIDPGYRNNWDQFWETIACIPVAPGGLFVAFDAKFDCEPGHDSVTLEYTTDCTGTFGWTVIDGPWDGNIPLAAYGGLYATVPPGFAKVRLHFHSDGGGSDEDGLYPSNGGAHFDNLVAGGLALETFEGVAPGALASPDWFAGASPGYGQYMSLFPGVSQIQQDACSNNLTCMWAAILGSTNTYACGGLPGQRAVPQGNAFGSYLANEVWSPLIPLPVVPLGSGVRLSFSVYRDNPIDNLVFYVWHVRTLDGAGCPGPWRDMNFSYYGGKDWLQQSESVGALLNFVGATDIQLSLGVVDQCGSWCGVYGDGICHSHAPLLDSVTLTSVGVHGPQWAIRDIDQFQDNFSTDGTLVGTVRADIAMDIQPGTIPGIVPGDCAVVTVADPVDGLGIDPAVGGAAVYMFVAVKPLGQPGKSGAGLTDDPVRWPHVPGKDFVAMGIPWTCLRLDQVMVNGKPVADKFCIDLDDNLFTPGDMICFFYAATNAAAFPVTTYAFGSNLGASGPLLAEAVAHPSEFTCLPGSGWQNGGDILYVDGMDGRGAQRYWDTAFDNLGILEQVDRYDIRGPSSGVNNALASRVVNIQAQLNDCYRKILWDCGDLSVTLGDGGATFPGHKTDDYGLINTFLDNLPTQGGVYLCGDDAAAQLNRYTGASAVTFKTTYITYALTGGNHVPSYGISPLGRGIAAGCFNGDTFVLFGGCPLVNDFDVMDPTGASLMEVSYGPPGPTNGAVISKRTVNSNGVSVGVLLSGFAFDYIRDDDLDGIADRFDHLHDIITWLGNVPPQPIGTGTVASNSLSQNYPNPFNPQTTIAFSVKVRGLVSLEVYNVAGQLVRTITNDEFAAGTHTKVWDGRDDAGQTVSSGVYFYRLVARDFTQTKKMVMLK